MIYTVTFNPSLDYIISTKSFQLGMTNRTDTEQLFPGGKGINVSIVLQNLDIENTALGFVAGFTKDYQHAFRMGVSAGSASAFSEVLATKEEILRICQTLPKETIC